MEAFMEFTLTAKEVKDEQTSNQKALVTKDPASSLGQRIGKFVSKGASAVYAEILKEVDGYEMGQPAPGKKAIRLLNILGKEKEIDDIITTSDTKHPTVLCESKWLKDQRHLNDKGAWVTLMREVQLANPTVQGLIAILAGPWASEVSAISQRVKVINIPVEDVYSRLDAEGIYVRIDTERNIYESPKEVLKKIIHRVEAELKNYRDYFKTVGYDLILKHKTQIRSAILAILDNSKKLAIEEVELILCTTHGNLIYQPATHLTEAKDLLEKYIELSESELKTLLQSMLRKPCERFRTNHK